MKYWKYFTVIACLFISLVVLAQDDNANEYDCSPMGLVDFYNSVINSYQPNVDDPDDNTSAILFQIGFQLQSYAIACDYQPDEAELQALIDSTLIVADLPQIIASLGVGSDVEVALAEIEDLFGDSFNGQLLYNGLEMGLDGNSLACSTCHNGEVAPLTEGTYTRIDEIRLQEDLFADYTVREYLVESILHPKAYIVPEYENLMGANYGTRLDAQMLADVVAFLESQDQLLDE